ncbi:MAG: hypothetical protein ACLR6Z_02825 [Dorea sp.]
MELGLVLTLCGLGAAFWLPAIIIGLISHGKKEKLYDEYGRTGHKNQQQIIG